MMTTATAHPLLEVDRVSKSYRSRPRGLTRRRTVAPAVIEASFDINQGRVVGLVGESGSGKTTIGRIVLGLVPLDRGEVRYRGEALAPVLEERPTAVTRSLTAVFQDPGTSLNPRMNALQIVSEPWRVVRLNLSRADTRDRVVDLLRQVGLPDDTLGRRPPELSGGQQQRLAIARALALEPRLVVADEALSALDVSVQAQILHLLGRLVDERDLSMLFISHDLSVVQLLCDDVVVLQEGRVVESGPTGEVLSSPSHEYTRFLMEVRPRLELTG